jgi:hypothetical protein
MYHVATREPGRDQTGTRRAAKTGTKLIKSENLGTIEEEG